MTRLFAWAHGVANGLRTPINKDGYRILAMVAVLVALLAATTGFIVIQSWEFALTCAILSLPGGLFAGVLSILWFRRHRAAWRRDARTNIASFAILLVAFGAMHGLSKIIPSLLVQLVVVTAAVVVIAIFQHVWRNHNFPTKRP
jgi:hypothetical protein